MTTTKYPEFEKLVEVIAALRDPKTGCPWDLEQTHESLLPFLIEESFEFIRSVENSDIANMKEEIGDVFLQVLLHAQLAKEKSHFNLEEVCQNLSDKLIRRHPHVFKNNDSKLTSEEVIENWKIIKNNEKNEIYFIANKLLDNTALNSAYKIGKKSTECHFDWENAYQVLYKVEEEWQELKEELGVQGKTLDHDRVEEELGDLLFSMAQLARHLNIEPEKALRKANQKFIKRFQFIEDELKKMNKSVMDSNTSQLESLWIKAKQH